MMPATLRTEGDLIVSVELEWDARHQRLEIMEAGRRAGYITGYELGLPCPHAVWEPWWLEGKWFEAWRLRAAVVGAWRSSAEGRLGTETPPDRTGAPSKRVSP